jgi:hypothetical protein
MALQSYTWDSPRSSSFFPSSNSKKDGSGDNHSDDEEVEEARTNYRWMKVGGAFGIREWMPKKDTVEYELENPITLIRTKVVASWSVVAHEWVSVPYEYFKSVCGGEGMSTPMESTNGEQQTSTSNDKIETLEDGHSSHERDVIGIGLQKRHKGGSVPKGVNSPITSNEHGAVYKLNNTNGVWVCSFSKTKKSTPINLFLYKAFLKHEITTCKTFNFNVSRATQWAALY